MIRIKIIELLFVLIVKREYKMTIKELENRLNTKTDNNYDQRVEFFAALNSIVLDLNLRMSAKFVTVDEDMVDTDKTIEDLTGIPSVMDIIVLNGMWYSLQIKEDEGTWTKYESTYNSYVNEYKHLVPQEYRLDHYNDIVFRECDNQWEIY